MVSGVRPEHLVEPLLINYPTFDGRYISGFLYVPHNLDESARRPAVVWAHNGPTRQQQNGFDPMIQYLVNRGYVVLAPNYRGSSGFGREFEALNDRDWGGGDLQDLVEAADFLKAQAYIDAGRVAVAGRGYGGYLSLLALCKTPDVWAAGIDISGPADLTRYYNLARKEDQATMRQEMGNPEELVNLWSSRSPIHFLSNIRVPLLVVQGERDLRVSGRDTATMVETLQTLGVQVEQRVYPAEGAQFVLRQSQTDMVRQTADFLARRLPEPSAASAGAPGQGTPGSSPVPAADVPPAAGASPPAEVAPSGSPPPPSAAAPSGNPPPPSAAAPSGSPLPPSAATPSGNPPPPAAATPSGNPPPPAAATPSGNPPPPSAATPSGNPPPPSAAAPTAGAPPPAEAAPPASPPQPAGPVKR
jgi:dienelactone hydrolase